MHNVVGKRPPGPVIKAREAFLARSGLNHQGGDPAGVFLGRGDVFGLRIAKQVTGKPAALSTYVGVIATCPGVVVMGKALLVSFCMTCQPSP